MGKDVKNEMIEEINKIDCFSDEGSVHVQRTPLLKTSDKEGWVKENPDIINYPKVMNLILLLGINHVKNQIMPRMNVTNFQEMETSMTLKRVFTYPI